MVLAVGWLNAQTNIANYGFSKSTGNTYVPISGGTKLFPTGTATTYDNSVSAAIALSSPFTYGGVAISSVYISTNGFITFGAAPSTTNYTGLSSTTSSITGAIAAFSQDGAASEATGATPEVSYLDTPTEFIVQWKDHANYFNRSTEKLNFQIRLVYATGEVRIDYGNCTDPGTSVSGTSAIQVGIRGNSTVYASNVNNLMIGNVPTGTTCDWSNVVTGFANDSNMYFYGTGNANIKIPNGLQFSWMPGTQAPVRTFTAASAITNSGATLAWTAPSGATSYNVQYRIPGTCSWTDWAGNPVATNSVTLSGLVQGTSYQVRVQAVNGSAQSIYSHIPSGSSSNGYSSTGTFTTLLNCSSTVTGLAATPTPDTAAISWTASTTAPGNGYEYYYSTSSTAPLSSTAASGATAAGVVTDNLMGLTPSTTYYFWVRGNCNGTDKGVWSSSKSFSTLGLCPTVSAPTSSQTGVSVNPTFTWTAIAGVVGYKITIGTTAGGSDILNNFDLGNVTTYTHPTALNYGVKYYYKISAYTATNSTSTCTERNFTVATLCPVVSAPASSALYVSTTPTFTWGAIAGVTGYKLTIGTTAGGNDILDAFDMGNVTSYTLPTALAYNTKYYYVIVAYAGSQMGSACAERNFTTTCNSVNVPYTQNFESVTTPAIPDCTGVVNYGTGNSWKTANAPSGSGFVGKVLNYNYASSDAANTWFFTQGINLTAGVSYRIKYKYSNSAGSSVYPEKLKVAYGTSMTNAAMTNALADHPNITTTGIATSNTVDFTPSTSGVFYFGFQAYSAANMNQLYVDDINIYVTPTCFEPTAVTATYNNATNVVNVSWTAPSPTPGNGYELFYSTSSTAPTDSTPASITGITGTSVDLPSLAVDTVYYIWVRSACSASNVSIWSDPFVTITTGYCQPTGGTSNQYYLKTISTTGATTNISYTATSYSAYVNNVATQLTAEQGMTVNYSLTPSGGSNYYYIWVDWNNDLDFEDANETILATTSYASSRTGTFTIPAGQVPGMYRMRVANSWSGSIVSCGPAPSGGYVDFTLNVTNGNLATVETSSNKGNIKVYPNPFSDVLNISDVDKVKSISIMDTSGKMVKSFEKAEAQIRLSDLSSGMYIVILNMKDGSKQTIKAIKK